MSSARFRPPTETSREEISSAFRAPSGGLDHHAHERLLPVPDGPGPGLGQCFPSSLLLFLPPPRTSFPPRVAPPLEARLRSADPQFFQAPGGKALEGSHLIRPV